MLISAPCVSFFTDAVTRLRDPQLSIILAEQDSFEMSGGLPNARV